MKAEEKKPATKSGVDPIYSTLNEPQREAVECTNGPLLILAGAGSGKTKALTHRIAKLIQDGVQPWEILSVTFTNKAAMEMKERIKNILRITEGEDLTPWQFSSGKLPVMGTFHSICARILRRDIEALGRDRTFVIYDKDDQQRLMKQVLKEMAIDINELKPKAVLGSIGRFKCEAIGPKEAEAQASSSRMHQIVDAYKKYQRALLEANALDFDDLMLETVRLFHEVPDVLSRYQNTWKYLHVDEYQDTNHAQYLFITMLAKKHKNLCVIGDPDQSIYAFRGADIRNILEFEKEYPGAKRIKLEQNYRSVQTILTGADSVIEANPNRPEKKMWTDKKEGGKIIVHEVDSEKKEAEEAIKAAEEKRVEGIPYNQQVILYRTNAQSRMFEEACMRSGIPYRIIGGVKFYARKEVKNVLAYLHLILNPNDTVALLRVINVPARKIGLTTISKLQIYGNENGLTLWETLKEIQNVHTINDSTKERLASFAALIQKYQTKAQTEVVSDLTGHLLNAISMEKWLKDGTEEGEARWQNVQELSSVMHKYDALDPHASLMCFLEEVALVSEVDKLQEATSDALTLMTLHLCKGLEFEHVMIAGCEEGIFPHSNCMFDKEQLEEERRIMYVGMTRAKSHLRILLARSRMLWGQTQANAPSRFIDDIDEAVTERRSDDVLSAFAWASKKGEEGLGTGIHRPTGGSKIEPFRQETDINMEFNQDLDFSDDMNQDQSEMTEGARIQHPTFGQGMITAVRGDVVDIRFDSGEKKSFALSVAPIKLL